jgi:Flp pilus assembly protein TadB
LSNERDALLREVVQLREAAECAQIELAYIVNLADRKGGRYEEALSKLNAALAKERYAVIQQK